MNLTEFKEKCKSDRVFIALVIILVGIGSFGLGRLSKIEGLKQGISIEAPAGVGYALKAQNKALNSDLGAFTPNKVAPDDSNSLNTTINTSAEDGQVVASKSGTKYHFPWCAGAKSISEKNKIWFNSIAEARKAGYAPASNCKGLK